MSAQIKPPGEAMWYCPARDITVLTPHLVGKALASWDETDGYRDSIVWMGQGVRQLTDECACQVAEALATMLSEETLMSDQTFQGALESSGLAKSPSLARMVVMATLGDMLLGAYWDGIRSATSSDDNGEFRIRQTDPKELADEARRLTFRLRRGYASKWVERFWTRLKLWRHKISE